MDYWSKYFNKILAIYIQSQEKRDCCLGFARKCTRGLTVDARIPMKTLAGVGDEPSN